MKVASPTRISLWRQSAKTGRLACRHAEWRSWQLVRLRQAPSSPNIRMASATEWNGTRYRGAMPKITRTCLLSSNNPTSAAVQHVRCRHLYLQPLGAMAFRHRQDSPSHPCRITRFHWKHSNRSRNGSQGPRKRPGPAPKPEFAVAPTIGQATRASQARAQFKTTMETDL